MHSPEFRALMNLPALRQAVDCVDKPMSHEGLLLLRMAVHCLGTSALKPGELLTLSKLHTQLLFMMSNLSHVPWTAGEIAHVVTSPTADTSRSPPGRLLLEMAALRQLLGLPAFHSGLHTPPRALATGISRCLSDALHRETLARALDAGFAGSIVARNGRPRTVFAQHQTAEHFRTTLAQLQRWKNESTDLVRQEIGSQDRAVLDRLTVENAIRRSVKRSADDAGLDPRNAAFKRPTALGDRAIMKALAPRADDAPLTVEQMEWEMLSDLSWLNEFRTEIARPMPLDWYAAIENPPLLEPPAEVGDPPAVRTKAEPPPF